MNPQAQRIAIAIACGWTQCQPRASVTDRPWISGVNPRPDKIVWVVPCDGSPGHAPTEADYGFESLPDYLNDLNAMHAAEHLRIVRNFNLYGGDTSIEHAYVNRCGTFATAAQRAEVFLKTLNLWSND